MEMTIDGRSFSIEETASNQLVAKVSLPGFSCQSSSRQFNHRLYDVAI